MMKVVEMIKGFLSNESPLSSKRFIVLLLVSWGIICGTYYVVMLNYGGDESQTTTELIKFAWMTAATIAVGGTAAEAIKRHKSS